MRQRAQSAHALRTPALLLGAHVPDRRPATLAPKSTTTRPYIALSSLHSQKFLKWSRNSRNGLAFLARALEHRKITKISPSRISRIFYIISKTAEAGRWWRKRLWRGGGRSTAHSRTLSHHTRIHCICMHCTRALVRCSTPATEGEAEIQGDVAVHVCAGGQGSGLLLTLACAHTRWIFCRDSPRPWSVGALSVSCSLLAACKHVGFWGSRSFCAFGHGAFSLSAQRATHAAASTKP